MDLTKLKEQVKSLTNEEKNELFQEIVNSLDNVRNSFHSSMEPVYKAVEPIAEAIASFKETVIHPIIKSEPFQSAVNSILSWVRNIDWQRVSDTYDLNSKFCAEIMEQLQAKDIDTAILQEFNLSQAAELYIMSNQCGLTFTDLIEDSIQLFGKFEYEHARTYLNIIAKRKNQTLDEAAKTLNIDFNYVENLKYSEKNISELAELALREYEKSDITLEEKEIKLLDALKQNRFSDDRELSRVLGLSLREVEESCEQMRKKFNIDYFEDDNVKRHLLINLARNIVIK